MNISDQNKELWGGVFSLNQFHHAETEISSSVANYRKGSAMGKEFKVGEIIDGKYKVLAVLGEGGMGRVVKVEDVKDKATYALKYCKETVTELTKRFAREARIMEAIRHRHVVRIVTLNLEHVPPYFVMPLATGSLQTEISELHQDEDAALDAFEQICLGIQAIHNSNACHRDIKPLNALRFVNGIVRVSDLGLAKFDPRDTTTLTQTFAFIGTRPYAAPEQLMPDGSKNADSRTDIYQLGKTLYELITGKSPALMELKSVPPGLAHIIRRATREEPNERYQTLGKLMDALKNYRLSKDPTQNPREAFENLVQQAEAMLANASFESENIHGMLHILNNSVQLAADTLVELLGRIPDPLLMVIARDFADEFAPAMEKYAKAVTQVISGYPFPYAEKVAKRMKVVFTETMNADLKKSALLATLAAAVDLHRFAAMEIFDGMLMAVKTAGDAMPIAEMLEDNLDRYRMIASRIPADRLYSVIREVRNKAIGVQSQQD